MSAESFSEAVARACDKIKAAGPWVIEPALGKKTARAEAKKPAKATAKQLQEGLFAAARRCDSDEAASWVARGASPHQMFGYDTLFDAWTAGSVASGSKPEAVAKTLLWLDEIGSPLTESEDRVVVADMADKLASGGALRKAARKAQLAGLALDDCDLNPSREEAFVALAKRWADGKPAERIAPQEWADAAADALIGDNYASGSPLLGMAVERLGAVVGPEKWKAMAKALAERVFDGDVIEAGEELTRALRAERPAGALDPQAGAALLTVAIYCDDIDLMRAVAERCPGLGWTLPKGASRMMSDDDDAPERPVSALSLALAQVPSAGKPWTGKRCLRALLAMPAAVADAAARPDPEAFRHWGAQSVEELARFHPELLAPGAGGRVCAHVWMEGERVGSAVAELIKLLRGPLAELAVAKDARGRAPVGIARERARAGDMIKTDAQKLEKAFAKWEAKQMRAEAGRAKKRAPAPKRL